MRSTDLKKSAALVAGAVLLAGCSSAGVSSSSSSEDRVPRIHLGGSRAQSFTSVGQLAKKSNAIVVAEATGTSFTKPLPKGNGSPDSLGTPYLRVKVVDVVSGTVSGKVIDVVSPGNDEHTGKPALAEGKRFPMFLAPAMYAKDDRAGGPSATEELADELVRLGLSESAARLYCRLLDRGALTLDPVRGLDALVAAASARTQHAVRAASSHYQRYERTKSSPGPCRSCATT